MTGARMNTLATLRGSIERIEAHGEAYLPGRVALGHADADATLQGGLAIGAMHEVFAEAAGKAPRRRVLSRAWRGGRQRGGRWSGYGRISPKLNRARCR